jgi:nicotinamidase-related amidase
MERTTIRGSAYHRRAMHDGFHHVKASPTPYPLSPGSTALVVIDMQLDFLAPQGWAGALGHDVTQLHPAIEPIATLLEAWRERGWPVMHTREVHVPDLSDCPPSQRQRAPRRKRIGDDGAMGRFLVDGEHGTGIIPELAPIEGELVIDKPGHGMFWATQLHAILQANCITHLVLTGASTELAVQSSLREAHDRGYVCLLVDDATESYDPAFKAATLAMIGTPRTMLGWHASSQAVLRALRQGF